MKLQKNNKYKNKIAAGLSAIIIASATLTGCSSNDIEITSPVETVEPTTISEPTPMPTSTPKPTPVPTPEIDGYVEELGIINEDVMISDAGRCGIIFKMPNGIAKIVEVVYESEGNNLTFYDVFTEIPIVTVTNCTQGEYYKIHYDEAKILAPYFENAEIVMLETQLYIDNYALSEFGPEEVDAYEEIISKYYGVTINDVIDPNKYSFNKRELAEMYIMTIPRENRVTVEELQTGLEKDSAKVLK